MENHSFSVIIQIEGEKMETLQEFIMNFDNMPEDPSYQIVFMSNLISKGTRDPHIYQKIEYVINQRSIDYLFEYYNLLHYACLYLDEQLVLYLLKKGANLNITSKVNSTAIEMTINGTAGYKEKKIKILQHLILHGASLKLENHSVYKSFYHLIKKFDLLDWLEEIYHNPTMLNPEQRKDLEAIRLYFLYK